MKSDLCPVHRAFCDERDLLAGTAVAEAA